MTMFKHCKELAIAPAVKRKNNVDAKTEETKQ